MKKQFFRVKQLADQTFSRAGKTDVLSDDLQEADRKVEYLKNSCQNVGKKLSGCLLLGQLQGETKEKLMKKSSSYQLAATMIECSATCDEDSLMKIVLGKCGYAEKTLSEEIVEHDHRVEQHVIAPLQSVLDTEIPNIIKQKRNLTKVCLDMDSAKTRYQQAQKHTSNNTAGAAKVESIKDELKDSEQKVEQSRDILACDMFHLAAKESELCYTILQYYKFQKCYHEYMLKVLDKLIPELENDIGSSKIKPVYGVNLEEHLQVTGRKIAFPIELCVCALIELGMEEEGLFRLAGGASKLKRMKLSFDAGCMTLPTALSYKDPHVIAGALKSYLRELPEPLLTHDLYDEWLNAAKAQTNSDNKLQALWTIVHKLPKANFDNLGYLIKFFHILSKNHETNKMSPHNLAIVIAPSLIWTKDENNGSRYGLNGNVSLYPSIIDLLVTYADWFFDKEMEFYLTLEPILNGESEEKGIDKGADNKGFELKAADKLHKSTIEKSLGQNYPGGDIEISSSDIKRSQSINSLSEECHVYESPKPITRRKNKSAAPVPPIFKDDKKKEFIRKDTFQSIQPKEIFKINDKPDKPPRPSVTSNSTLPRSKSNKETKSTETNLSEEPYFEDNMGQVKNLKNDSTEITLNKKDKTTKTVVTVSTNTDSPQLTKVLYPTNSLDRKRDRPIAAPRSIISTIDSFEKSKSDSENKPNEYNKVNLISVKKEWLLGKDSADIENLPVKKPAVPERPSTLKPQIQKFNRSSTDVSFHNNYENISLSSNKNPTFQSSDDRLLQKTQLYCIDKQQVSIIGVNNENNGKIEEIVPNIEVMPRNSAEMIEKHSNEIKEEKKDNSNKNVIVTFVEERKTAASNSNRPLSLPGADKPERPPKPDYKFSPSSSHVRAFSDGQIIDVKPSGNTDVNISVIGNNSNNTNTNNNEVGATNNNNNDGNNQTIKNNDSCEMPSLKLSPPTSPLTVKHPQTSPPPPPVPAKPRANSQSESTDF